DFERKRGAGAHLRPRATRTVMRQVERRLRWGPIEAKQSALRIMRPVEPLRCAADAGHGLSPYLLRFKRRGEFVDGECAPCIRDRAGPRTALLNRERATHYAR